MRYGGEKSPPYFFCNFLIIGLYIMGMKNMKEFKTRKKNERIDRYE